MNQPSSALRDYLTLHLVVLAWGFTSVLGKLLTLPAVEVALWRTSLAALGLGAVAHFRGHSLAVSRRDSLIFLGTGVLIGWHWILFFLSARLSTASVCLAAMPTIMLWCSLLEPLVNGTRRWSVSELFAGTVIMGAVWLIYKVEFTHGLGFTVGLLSAFVAAVFNVLNKGLAMRCHPLTICFYQMIGACAGSALALPFLESSTLHLPTPADWLWLLLLSMLCTVGAYLAYLDLLRRLSVFAINVVYNLEPVYGILLAIAVFGRSEFMSSAFYFGAALILAAVFALPWWERRKVRLSAVAASGLGEG